MAAGETIAPEPCASVFGSWANGAEVRMTRVLSSTMSAPAIGFHSGRLVVLMSLFIIRSMLNLIAAASHGVPSWKVTPARSLSSHDFRSSLMAKDSASCGTIFMSASKSSRRSNSSSDAS